MGVSFSRAAQECCLLEFFSPSREQDVDVQVDVVPETVKVTVLNASLHGTARFAAVTSLVKALTLKQKARAFLRWRKKHV